MKGLGHRKPANFRALDPTVVVKMSPVDWVPFTECVQYGVHSGYRTGEIPHRSGSSFRTGRMVWD